MKYVSKRQNFVAIGLIFILGISIILFTTLICIKVPLKGVFELCIMLCGVFIIQISGKNILASYEYIIDSEDELLQYNRLTVVSVSREKRTSLITLKLSQLEEVLPYKQKKLIKEKCEKNVLRYSFCPDILPKESYLLVFDHIGQKSVVRIQCTKEFVSILEKRSGV